MDVPILRYPLLIDIEKDFHFIYGQIYSPFECDVPWSSVRLPIKGVKYFKGNESIVNEIKCLQKYNGVWYSDTSKVLIYFNPHKVEFIRRGSIDPEELKISTLGLINGSLPKFKFKSLTCEIFASIKELKDNEKKKIKEKILNYYKLRNFNKITNTKLNINEKRGVTLPQYAKFQPVSDFIAQNYYDLNTEKVKKNISLLDVLDVVKDEQIYFSPVMTITEEINHCNHIYNELKRMILDNPIYKSQLKEVKSFVNQLIKNFNKNFESSNKIGALDLISLKCVKTGLNLSKLIFNYKLLNEIDSQIREGLYIFFKNGSSLGFVHSILYKEFRYIKRGLSILDLSKWKFYGKDVFLVSKLHYQKVNPTENEMVKIDYEFYKNNNSKQMYLVQIKKNYFDFVRVNTENFPFSQGSVRINCLCKFYFKGV